MYRRIRDLREDKDWTQKQVANFLNCSQQVYSNYELGQRDIPTQILLELAALHKTSVDYLLGSTDELTPYPQRKRQSEYQ
ncbi:MAG: helix-turn-helix domain-containing protein [Defluviitaleaceae bacterium]|nr:helix-turn-helix domain-containing protein [Defluviitaleaceae bacterium]MCL2263562.1 helix-turn-helix domain-containing protein [Defluviitaleaceae bacterium]